MHRYALVLAAMVAALSTHASAFAQAGPVGVPGRYVIVHSPHVQRDTVLLDTLTGKTWQLQRNSDRDADVWVPLAREDNPVEMQAWLRDNPRPSAAQTSNAASSADDAAKQR